MDTIHLYIHVLKLIGWVLESDGYMVAQRSPVYTLQTLCKLGMVFCV